MDLLIGGILNGIAYGALYGLLGFAIILLYKSTGIANFGQGNLGALAAFVVYELAVRVGAPLWLALLCGLLSAALAGALSYLVVMRPRDQSDHVNATIRTLGLYLLLFAVMNFFWAQGQPFNFPAVVGQSPAFRIGSVAVSWLTVGTLLAALMLSGLFAWFFQRTDLGLLFLGVASRPEIAKLMGVPTRRLTLMAWAASAIVSLVVAVLIAPVSLLSTDMMDSFLLYAFTAAIVGGLTSLVGVFVGGMMVGLLDNVATIYINSDVALLVVFVLLLIVLLFKPQGLFGRISTERL